MIHTYIYIYIYIYPFSLYIYICIYTYPSLSTHVFTYSCFHIGNIICQTMCGDGIWSLSWFGFLVVLGLGRLARAFSSRGERGPLPAAACGTLAVMTTPVAQHRLEAWASAAAAV